MANDFSQVMSERTDKQLVDIVLFKRDEYQLEALEAAEKELAQRQINIETFYSEQEKIEKQQVSEVVPKSDMPFERKHIILTIVSLPVFLAVLTILFEVISKIIELQILRLGGFIGIILTYYSIHRWLKQNGYTNRAKEFFKWITYTLYIYIGFVLIVGLLV